MATRRDFLTVSAAALAQLGLDACCPVCPTGPGIRGPEMVAKCKAHGVEDPLWGADLRGQFRILECLTQAALADPQFERAMTTEIRKRYLRLWDDLASYTYSRTIAEGWRLLYELTARLHDYRNERSRSAKIPVYAYNGHENAARVWIDESHRRRLGPLLHLDTHDDMRGLTRPERIVRAAQEISGGGRRRERALRLLTEYIHDHATPVSGGVLGLDLREVVWCFPSWAYCSEFKRRPLFYADVPNQRCSYGSFRLIHDKDEDGGALLPTYSTAPWLEASSVPAASLKGMTHRRSFRMTLVKTHPIGSLGGDDPRFQAILEAVPKGPFILDIDLDYFMSIDSSSGFKRGGDVGNKGASRKRSADVDAYEQKLVKAKRLLDERLIEFGRLIVKLRDAGRIPSVVTLADSTYLPFATTAAGRGYWEYTPFEFAAFLHWKVRTMLAKIYRSHGIDAGV